MKEIRDILKAYAEAKSANKKTALATVVKVEGSSYRQPGARMLVTEDGELTGAISGGCLEGDALKRALLAIHQQQNKLITYDTSNEDDVEFGVQLGCNGIVHILFEYIDDTLINNPIALLKALDIERRDAIVVTLFSADRKAQQPGTVLLYRDGQTLYGNEAFTTVLTDVQAVMAGRTSAMKTITVDFVTYEALIEYIAPPLSLLVAGAGNDVKPLVQMAAALGWEVTVADGRATHATVQRFPEAKAVIVAKPEQLISQVAIDAGTYVVLMTHNYNYDLALLQLLLDTDCRYIGILGPKTKLNRMLADLDEAGRHIDERELEKIYGPVGLDIGAEPSEEIAVSVIAEILAVKNGKTGTSLKYRTEKIHNATMVV